MLKKVFALIISTAICLPLFSGCGESAVGEAPAEEETTKITTETTSETTTEATTDTTVTAEETTTERKLTADEVELMNSMPDIVFVLSHHYNGENVAGFFITNTGEMKMYDFRDREPGEYCNVVDVLNELESGVCSEIEFQRGIYKESDLAAVSKISLIDMYNKLLAVDKDSEIEMYGTPVDAVYGQYELYGVRNSSYDIKEAVFLYGWGNYFYENTDTYAQDIYWNKEKIFPGIESFYSI